MFCRQSCLISHDQRQPFRMFICIGPPISATMIGCFHQMPDLRQTCASPWKSARPTPARAPRKAATGLILRQPPSPCWRCWGPATCVWRNEAESKGCGVYVVHIRNHKPAYLPLPTAFHPSRCTMRCKTHQETGRRMVGNLAPDF